MRGIQLKLCLTEEGNTMCGRFAQYRSRDEYFDLLGLGDGEIIHDPEPVGRYNVAPGTKVLLLNERDHDLHLDPVLWG